MWFEVHEERYSLAYSVTFFIFAVVNQMLGKCNFKNGQVYDGEWMNDKANGHGMTLCSISAIFPLYS